MTVSPAIYCLDANVLIQAWQNYYSPKICRDYWNVLNELGKNGSVFVCEEIAKEIHDTEDDLSDWLKQSAIAVRKTDGNVTGCWKQILDSHIDHQYLVAAAKGRSLADPWVVSHALDAGATVVTKEQFTLNYKQTKIKIPNVCASMGIPWMDDFHFAEAIGLEFSCRIK